MEKAAAWEEGRSHHQPRIGGGGGATMPSGLDQEHPERRAHRTAFLGLLEGIPKLLSSGFPKISSQYYRSVVPGQFAVAALIAERIDQGNPPG